jgi:hypothetical protein
MLRGKELLPIPGSMAARLDLDRAGVEDILTQRRALIFLAHSSQDRSPRAHIVEWQE